MRKVLYFAAGLITAVSCLDEIYPVTMGPETLLGINADLYTTDTLHTVLVYYSLADRIEYAKDATVSIYVNGALVDSTSEDREPYPGASKERTAACYDLKAVLSAGDTVKIAARKDELHSFSEVVVPRPAAVGDVTAEVVPSGGVDFSVTVVDDVPGLDYYAIEMSAHRKCTRDKDGKVLDEEARKIKMDVSGEPLFTRNFQSSFNGFDDMSQKLFSAFNYWVFTDNAFRGGSYNLSLHSGERNFFRPMHSMSGEIVYDEGGNPVYVGEQYSMDIDFEVFVSRVTRQVYNNLMSEYLGYCAISNLILLDTGNEYQTNVTGGTGIVNIYSCTRREIHLGPFHYDMWNRNYPL